MLRFSNTLLSRDYSKHNPNLTTNNSAIDKLCLLPCLFVILGNSGHIVLRSDDLKLNNTEESK